MIAFVVFDNNAYKCAHSDRMQRIMAAERALGVKPLANLVVLQELLARARDSDLRERGRNRSAIRKLGEHCRGDRNGQTVIDFFTHVEGQVYRMLAGEEHPGDREAFDAFGDLVRVVSQALLDDDLAEIAEDLEAIEELVQRAETEYVSLLAKAIDADVQPNPMTRNLDYAAEKARRAEALYGRRFTPEQIFAQVLNIAKTTSIAFAVRDGLVKEVRDKRGGHTNHGNTVWDEEVVSSTSMYTTIQGSPVVLVTEERRLLAAAAQAGAGDRVMDLAGYETRLNLSPWNDG